MCARGFDNLVNQREILRRFIDEIELFNDAYGLVKVSNRDELIRKHILDSLAPLEIIERLLGLGEIPQKSFPKIADAGSGAGLPGIPLAVCMTQAEFTLIERMGRRAGFLQNCVAMLGLSNVSVEETEIEKAAPGRFDVIVFRAFRPLTPDILNSLFRLLNPRGFLAAWKGRLDHSRDEMINAEKNMPGLKWEILPVNVPFLEEQRHLTVIGAPTKIGAPISVSASY